MMEMVSVFRDEDNRTNLGKMMRTKVQKQNNVEKGGNLNIAELVAFVQLT